MKRWILAIFLFGTLAFAQNPTSPSYKSYLATASGADVAINQIGTGLDFHKLTWNVVGSVSTCSVQVDTSSDGISWSGGAAVGSQTCTSSGSSSVSGATANYVRINVTAFSGTGSVLILYQGYNNNPSGGGGSGTITNQFLNQLALGGATAAAVSGTVANGLTGQVLQSTNAAAPSFVSPGLPWGNSDAEVTTTPYNVPCDSGTSVAAGDRGKTTLFGSGASVINLPDPTAAGCTGNFAVSLYDDGAGTLTVNRGGTSTINIVDGSTNTDAATSFTLATGQYALCNANAAGTIWACSKKVGGSAATINGVSCGTCSVGALWDTNGLPSVSTATVASQVNAFTVTPAITGQPPTLFCSGSDATVGCEFGNKGGTSFAQFTTTGAINFTLANNQNAQFTLAGTGSLYSRAGQASEVPMACKMAASPTGDCFQVWNSSFVPLASFGPSGIVGTPGAAIVTGADITLTNSATVTTVISYTLPTTAAAKTYEWRCDGIYESTGATLVGATWGVNLSAAPTQQTAMGSELSALAGTTESGYISNATTGSQTVITGAAVGVASTPYPIHLNGSIEAAPTAGSTFIINVVPTSSTTTTLVIKRGFSCYLSAIL